MKFMFVLKHKQRLKMKLNLVLKPKRNEIGDVHKSTLNRLYVLY